MDLKRSFLFVFCFLVIFSLAFQCEAQVKPIKWTAFNKPAPTDSLALMERNILLNAVKYGLTTWYNEEKKFGSQTTTYLDLGGTDEHNIRPVASEAQAFAVALKTNAYDETLVGIPQNEAKEICLKLIRSVSYHHKANEKGGWGEAWQSAVWAAYVGAAGWMMWDELSVKDREYVKKMVEFEANRLNDYVVPYMRNKKGDLLIKGDSKSEENSWNATILQLAVAMMPDHPHVKIWMDKNIELMLSANVRPQDVNCEKKFNGRKLKDIVNGSNYNEDGTVTNHGRIHPDYMACTSQTFYNALMFSLARRPTPKAAFYNAEIIYKTLTDFKFKAPPFLQPGGTIYITGSSEIYYPETNDWGKDRRMHFALMDCQMSAFNLDNKASHSGAYWEGYHAKVVLDMQRRSADGRTYQAIMEDTYKSREEWVAVQAAQAYLTKWLLSQREFSLTNKTY